METTDILKLKKPSQNDFYNVNDFNANMDILEGEAAKAKSRQATLLVHAPAGYSIEVVHQSGSYTAVSNTVGKDAYATLSHLCVALCFPVVTDVLLFFTCPTAIVTHGSKSLPYQATAVHLLRYRAAGRFQLSDLSGRQSWPLLFPG